MISSTRCLVNLRDIAPRTTERGILVGCTGCGKTTLAKALLPLYRHAVAVDPKCTLGADARGRGHLPGYELCRSPNDLVRAGRRHERLQYRPDPAWQNLDGYEQVYGWLFDRHNTFIYTDEAFLIMEGNRIPDAVRACVTSGRERGIGMLTATQRPSGVDLRLLTEAERFYCFRLRHADDLKRMEHLMGGAIASKPAKGHAFYYSGPSLEEPVYYRLSL